MIHGQNFSLITEHVTAFGRILPIHETGLRPVNQRRMAKAIRRAIALGLHPSVHHHPQIMLLKSRNGLPLVVTSKPPTKTTSKTTTTRH